MDTASGDGLLSGVNLELKLLTTGFVGEVDFKTPLDFGSVFVGEDSPEEFFVTAKVLGAMTDEGLSLSTRFVLIYFEPLNFDATPDCKLVLLVASLDLVENFDGICSY